MDRTTRCLHCGRRLLPATVNGRTELQCVWCDEIDPLDTDAARWAENPLAKQAIRSDSLARWARVISVQCADSTGKAWLGRL
jgi:phage FluMu protein Com